MGGAGVEACCSYIILFYLRCLTSSANRRSTKPAHLHPSQFKNSQTTQPQHLHHQVGRVMEPLFVCPNWNIVWNHRRTLSSHQHQTAARHQIGWTAEAPLVSSCEHIQISPTVRWQTEPTCVRPHQYQAQQISMPPPTHH